MKPVRLLCYLFLWTWRCTALSNVAIILILSTEFLQKANVFYTKIACVAGIGFFFLKAKGEKSRTAQKQWVRLSKQLLCTCITLLCTFPCRHCTTTMWKCLDFTFRRGREHKTTTSFSFPELRYSSLELNSRENAKFWRIQRDGISVIKVEAGQLHFFGAVFVAVAVVAA